MWYDDRSEMTKVGLVRAILMRSNDAGSYCYPNRKVTIVGREVFSYGFVCDPKRDYTNRGWIEEEFFHLEDQFEEELKGKPNGFYELIGELYYEGWSSYEGEYDSIAELRDVKVQEISFDQAMCFDDDGPLTESMVALVPVKGDANRFFLDDGCISPYMTKRQILRRYADKLARLINPYSQPPWSRDMTEKTLEDYIFTLTLEIDSTELEHPARALAAKGIHEVVQKVLIDHDSCMVEDSEPTDGRENGNGNDSKQEESAKEQAGSIEDQAGEEDSQS